MNLTPDQIRQLILLQSAQSGMPQDQPGYPGNMPPSGQPTPGQGGDVVMPQMPRPPLPQGGATSAPYQMPGPSRPGINDQTTPMPSLPPSAPTGGQMQMPGAGSPRPQMLAAAQPPAMREPPNLPSSMSTPGNPGQGPQTIDPMMALNALPPEQRQRLIQAIMSRAGMGG